MNEDELNYGEEEFKRENINLSEEDMSEGYHMMTNTNSVEYDEGDYESDFDPLEGLDPAERRRRTILMYGIVIAILFLIVTVGIAYLLIK